MPFLSIPPFSLFGISWWVEQGSSNRHRFRLFFQTDSFITNIHHQFLKFLYQCIKKTSIYHIISNFPKNCRRNTQKTDKVYNFLQHAKLTCVGDLWTQALRKYVRLANHHGATSVRRHSLTSFGISLVDFLSSKVIHAGQLCGLEEIVDFVRSPCVAAAILEKIADNVINGSLSTFIKCLPHPVQFYPVKVSHVLYECQNRNAVRELVSFTVSIEITRLSYFLDLYSQIGFALGSTPCNTVNSIIFRTEVLVREISLMNVQIDISRENLCK